MLKYKKKILSNYIYISDDSICAMHIFSSRWHCLIHNDDVKFHYYRRHKTNEYHQ